MDLGNFVEVNNQPTKQDVLDILDYVKDDKQLAFAKIEKSFSSYSEVIECTFKICKPRSESLF